MKYVVLDSVMSALKRNLGVRVKRLVALTDPRDLRNVLFGIGYRRNLLHHKKVAEAKGSEAVHVLNAKEITLLDFDINPRWSEYVVGDEIQVLEAAHADCWNYVLVGR